MLWRAGIKSKEVRFGKKWWCIDYDHACFAKPQESEIQKYAGSIISIDRRNDSLDRDRYSVKKKHWAES